MPSRKRIISSDHYFHISARSSNREWFQLSLDRVWEIFEDYLYFLHHGFNFEILSFVLMNNHFHMICKTPDGNLSEAMNYFMRETSRVIGFETNRINHIYGGPFHSTLLENNWNVKNAYKYVYRNPIEAGLTGQAERWKYSTLNRLLGGSRLTIPVKNDFILFGEPSLNSTLEWINTSYKADHREQLKIAMRRPVFKLPRDPKTKRSSSLKDSLA